MSDEHDPLTPEQRDMARSIYGEVIAALNSRKAPNKVAFSVLGAILSQCVENAAANDPPQMHSLVDEFAVAAHKIVDTAMARRRAGGK